MTRIIAGFAGSLSIDVPRTGTRPTSDRVREAIFSALDARDSIRGAGVVDLYAGSGALGLETASRGAARVILVEKSAPAAAVCRRNAATVLARSAGEVTIDVVVRSVHSFLSSAAADRSTATDRSSTATGWDIAFLDPPYDLGEDDLARDLALLAPLLSGGAVVVVERSSRSPEPVWPAALEPERRRDYGDTRLWWASRSG